jgi:hypothetical protein
MLRKIKDNPFKDANNNLLELVDMADVLLKFEDFKNLIICPPTNKNYHYNKEEGFYEEVSTEYVERLINLTLRKYNLYLTYIKISNLYKQISLIKGVEESETKTTQYICFSNGLLDLETKELIPHTPRIFCTDNLGFPYKKDCEINDFMDYLNHLCSSGEQKKCDFLNFSKKEKLNKFIVKKNKLRVANSIGRVFGF